MEPISDLERFLALPDADSIVEEIYINDRIGTFRVRAMSQADFKEYQRQAQGRIGRKGMDFDVGKFNLLMVAGQVIQPDFANAEFLKKAGCVSAEQFISKKLLPGEIAELAKKIQEISGFDNEPDKDLEEAKN